MAVEQLEDRPGMLPLYARAALGSLPGAGLVPLIARRGDDIPELELELAGTEVDRDHLATYCRVCGFTLRDELPPTYPHVLAFPLQMKLLTDPRFPFAPIGLIHVANRIVQRRPIGLREALDLRVRATPLTPHPKGRAFKVVTEARVGDELVWEGTNTELHRGKGDPEAADAEPGPEPLPDDARPDAEWRLPGDLGRRYAEVSGDRNPIHLYGLTAKAFGFPRAIAHGMWTKARCLAALESRLPDSFEVEVRLRRPILLPGKVTFATESDPEKTRFAVRDAADATPHLDGAVSGA